MAAWALPVALAALTAWQGREHCAAMLSEDLRLDPFLRYAQATENAVRTMREEKGVKAGDLRIIVPFMGEAVDLAKGIRREEGMRRMQFLPIAKALYGGRSLRIFFPELRSVEIMDGADDEGDWTGKTLWWTFGLGKLGYLGQGEQAREALVSVYYRYKEYRQAARVLDLLIAAQPRDAERLYGRATLALEMGDVPTARAILTRLEELAASSAAPPISPRLASELRARLDAVKP